MHYYAYLVFGRMCSALMLIVVQQRYARFTMCPHIYVFRGIDAFWRTAAIAFPAIFIFLIRP